MTERGMGCRANATLHHKSYPGAVSVPARAREACALHASGVPIKEIATKYNVSVSAVRKWIYTVNEARIEASRR
jgi:transposase